MLISLTSRRNFTGGTLAGALLLTVLVLTLRLTHVLIFDGLALRGLPALTAAVGWAAAFLAVGMTEEMLFRGLLFGALAPRIGVLAAALVSALLFGAAHGDGTYVGAHGELTSGAA